MLEVWDVTTLTASHWHYLTHLFKERQLHDIWCKICLSSVWMFAVIHVIKWNRIICSPNWGCSDAVNTCGGSAVWCHVKFSAWRSDMKQLEYRDVHTNNWTYDGDSTERYLSLSERFDERQKHRQPIRIIRVYRDHSSDYSISFTWSDLLISADVLDASLWYSYNSFNVYQAFEPTCVIINKQNRINNETFC